MSEVSTKEERVGLLAAAEVIAEETAGAAKTACQPLLLSLPAGQQPPVPAAVCQANNNQQLQYMHPNIIMQSYPPEYYYYPTTAMADYTYQQQLPPGPGHPQGVMAPCGSGGGGTLFSRRSSDDQGRRGQRLAKNRQAAKKSRARKKEFHEHMRMRLIELEAEVKRLQERLSYFTQANMCGGVPMIGYISQ